MSKFMSKLREILKGKTKEYSPVELNEPGYFNKTHVKKKKIIIFSIIGFILLAVLGTGIYALIIWNNPLSPFEDAAHQAAATTEKKQQIMAQSCEKVPDEDDTGEEGLLTQDEITPTVDPYAELVSKSDLTILEKTVNIMLIGVDYAEERETWNGKHAYHADVMIVLSMNTEKNEAHLISLPRDTYAKIPGVKGIYKLNASIDCGGGWPTDGGFNKVCEAASWMLGGIPVKYYYAVDMAAVKALVDTIGGLDYNIDIDFAIQGRIYKAGMQHMNGQAVLDYLRVRKHLDADEAGDLNRINRQKELLIAIFKKLKESDLLFKLPNILGAFKGSLYTNTTLAQTGGLAAFASKLGSDKISMHSMDGKYANGIFNWNFVITDQNKRVQLIKKVYGIDVKAYSEYDYGSAMALWNKMQNKIIVSKAKSVLATAKKKLDADAALPDETPPPSPSKTPEPSPTPSESVAPSEIPAPPPSVSPSTAPGESTQPSESPTVAPNETPSASSGVSQAKTIILNATDKGTLNFKPYMHPAANRVIVAAGYRKYGSEVWALYNRCRDELKTPGEQLKGDIERLCSALSINKPNWRVNYEKGSNEIKVDFN